MSQLLLPEKVEFLINKLYENVNTVICGKQNTVDKMLMALLAGGHVLLEDVPGLGKTLLAKTIAKSIDAKFRRVQCTPDLLPSDITGVSIFYPETREFKFIQGPIFTNVLLVDEINRAAPRTQSCLLEAMEESQITIEGTSQKLEKPFFVIATQNPIEYHGTFDLPEAQLDRFLIVLGIGYPDQEEEDTIIEFYLNNVYNNVEPVISLEDYLMLHECTRKVSVSKEIRKYVLDIINATRNDTNIKLGASPRGTLALLRMAQSSAILAGRNYVIPDDVKNVAVEVLSHRVIPTHKRGLLVNNSIISELVKKITVP